jgi:hypothetical protein
MKVAAQNIMRCDAATQLEANIELDPDAQLTWGSTHQRSVTTGLPAVR